jgi:hypothetical protein
MCVYVCLKYYVRVTVCVCVCFKCFCVCVSNMCLTQLYIALIAVDLFYRGRRHDKCLRVDDLLLGRAVVRNGERLVPLRPRNVVSGETTRDISNRTEGELIICIFVINKIISLVVAVII